MAEKRTVSTPSQSTLSGRIAHVQGAAAAHRFRSLAERLVAVPKEEVDQLRADEKDDGAAPITD